MTNKKQNVTEIAEAKVITQNDIAVNSIFRNLLTKESLPFLESHGVVKNKGVKIEFPTPESFFRLLEDTFLRVADREESDLVNYIKKVEIKGSDEVSIIKDGVELKSFNRLNFCISLEFNKMTYKIGVVFAFDLGKPIIKSYAGFEVAICLNLSVFSAQQIEKSDYMTNPDSYIDFIEMQFSNFIRNAERENKIIETLKNTIVPFSKKQEFIGYMFEQTVKNETINGVQSISHAVKALNNGDSIYFWNENVDKSMWELMNCFTDYFGGVQEKVHILDQPEKNLAVSNLINNFKF